MLPKRMTSSELNAAIKECEIALKLYTNQSAQFLLRVARDAMLYERDQRETTI